MNILLTAAEKAANWMMTNQLVNRLDANKGRTINSYSAESGELDLTTSWQTGGVCMGLLAMYKRTGDKVYLDRAELAGRYVMSLQVMDHRQPRYYGAFRECTPQSLEFCPRDATTAAWSMVWLYEATSNPEYLDRAVLFGNWHLQYGMYDGWPLWAVIMDGQDDLYAKGSFQSGTGLFYHDLFMVSGDTRYIDYGLKPIARRYRDDFFRPDGSIIGVREIFSNQNKADKRFHSCEFDMHQYNDDFGNAMLQTAADLFGDESYRETALKFAHWLADNQDADGGFRNNKVPSAVAMGLMYFHDLGNFYQDSKLLAAKDKTLKKLLSMQFAGTGNQRVDGGFKEAEGIPGELCVNMRTSMYALVALLKVESSLENIWLGRNNRKFKDRLWTLKTEPYVFRW